MGQLVVEGGRRLAGTFRVNGAKNAALPLMAASILVEGPLTFQNLPLRLRDIQLMMQILTAVGVRVTAVAPDVLTVDASGPIRPEVPDALMAEMRASLFVTGPLLGRTGTAVVSRPGGCDIGLRPIDLHLKGLKALGAQFEDLPGGRLRADAPSLYGAAVYLDFPSVGATENIMMAAVMAHGETVIENAAREPEIVDLAQFLNRMGANVAGAGTDTIRIAGPSRLRPADHVVVPDRIEAGTVAVAAVISGGSVNLTHVVPEHLSPLWRKLVEMGADVTYMPGGDTVRVAAPQDGRLKAVTLRTGPHPGFPTDLQPQMAALMTQANGTSTLVETVFENRLKHMSELKRMGAEVLTDGRMAVITGPVALTGAAVTATDLRAGAALVLAGLAAQGETRVEGLEVIQRGYQDLAERLRALGAKAWEEGMPAEAAVGQDAPERWR